MPLFNQGGKRRSARLWDDSHSLKSPSSLLPSAATQLPPMSTNPNNNANMASTPMYESFNNTMNHSDHQQQVPSEEQEVDNEAYWDNYYEYDKSNGWVNRDSSEIVTNPPQLPTPLPIVSPPPMKANYDKGLDHDYYNDPSYITTNEEADRYYNDPRTTVSNGPSQPTAEERVLLLEEEIRQLMDTNRTLQQSIQDVQATLASMSIARQHPVQVTTIPRASPTPSTSSHSSNRASTPSSVSAGSQFQRPRQAPQRYSRQANPTTTNDQVPSVMPSRAMHPPTQIQPPAQSQQVSHHHHPPSQRQIPGSYQPVYQPPPPHSHNQQYPPQSWYNHAPPPQWWQHHPYIPHPHPAQLQPPHMTQVTSKDMEIQVDTFKSKESYLTWRSQLLLKLSQHHVYYTLTARDPVTSTLQLNPQLQHSPMKDRENRLLFMALYKAVREHGGVHVTQSMSKNADGYALLERLDMKHLGQKSDPVDQTNLVTSLYKLTRNNEESIEKFGHRFIQHCELCLYHKTPPWSVETLGTLFITNLRMPRTFRHVIVKDTRNQYNWFSKNIEYTIECCCDYYNDLVNKNLAEPSEIVKANTNNTSKKEEKKKDDKSKNTQDKGNSAGNNPTQRDDKAIKRTLKNR